MNVFEFPRVPYGSSSWRVDFQCPVCGCPGSRRIIKRRVRGYQEKLGGRVAVTVAARCPMCGIKGHHRVVVHGNRVYSPTLKGVS